MAYFCVGDGSFTFGGVVAALNGRETEDRPRSVKGRHERIVCSFGSFKD